MDETPPKVRYVLIMMGVLAAFAGWYFGRGGP